MLPASLASTPIVFKGVRFQVRSVQRSRRSGGTQTREIVEPPDSVVVLPVFDNGDVLLIRNERFAVGQVLWELCAGTLEPGEGPEDCAARELIEETGHQADRLTPLIGFYPTPGFCTEFMHGYLATGLKQVGQDLDETEQITPQIVSMDRALTLIRQGAIQDAKTIALLLYHHVFQPEAR